MESVAKKKRVLALAALIDEALEILDSGSQARGLWESSKEGVKSVTIETGTMAVTVMLVSSS